MFGTCLWCGVHELLIICKRSLRFAIRGNKWCDCLQWEEKEVAINTQREILPDRNRACMDEIKKEKEQSCTHRIRNRPLHEIQAAQIAKFFEFQFQNLVSRTIQMRHLLPC